MSLHFVFCHHFVVSPHPQSPTTTLVGLPTLHFGADVPVIIFRREQAPYQFSGSASPMMPVTLAFRSADGSFWPPPLLGSFHPVVYLVPVPNLSGLPPPPDPIRVLGPLPVHVLLGPHPFLCPPPGPLQVFQPPPSPVLQPPPSPGDHPPGPPGPVQVLEPPPSPVLEPPASSGQCLGPPASPVQHPAGPPPPPVGPPPDSTSDRQVYVKFVSEGITRDEIDRYFQRELQQLNRATIDIEDIRYDGRSKEAIVTLSAPDTVQLMFSYRKEIPQTVNNKQFWMYPYSYWLQTKDSRRACLTFHGRRVPTVEQIRSHFNHLDVVSFQRQYVPKPPRIAHLIFYTSEAVNHLVPKTHKDKTVAGVKCTARRYFTTARTRV